MIKKLFALSILICMNLLLFIRIYERQQNGKVLPVSTTFYENVIAITFDDGPHSNYTELLLDGLKERGVRASFFVVGERIKGNEELILRMSEEGHLIGNHTYSHIQLSMVNEEAVYEEIDRTNAEIESITGNKVEYIRPPYGTYDEELECAINMSEVMWTIDPKDWDTKDVDKIVEAVVNEASDGDIILLHDIYPSSVAAALKIIDELQDKGFVFVTVDEILIK